MSTIEMNKAICRIWMRYGILIGAVGLIYVLAFSVDTLNGGYSLKLQRSETRRWVTGMTMMSGMVWQPRWGKYGVGENNLLGEIWGPLIELDRRFWHRSKDIFDSGFEDWHENLPIEMIHPDYHEAWNNRAQQTQAPDR